MYGKVPEASVKRKDIQLSHLMIRCAEEKGLLKKDYYCYKVWVGKYCNVLLWPWSFQHPSSLFICPPSLLTTFFDGFVNAVLL